MAATCKFCNRIFEKKQGVRAHLKACANYLVIKDKRGKPQGSPKASLTKPQTAHEPAFTHKKIELSDGTIICQGEDGMRYFDSARERLLYHRDQEAKHDTQNKIQLQKKQAELRLKEEEESRMCQKIDAEQKVQEEKDLHERRRKIIQEVKHMVIDCHIVWPSVPVAAKAAVKIAIEKELLSFHRLLELPRFEINQIAEGIREKIYAPYIKALESKKPTHKEVIDPMIKEKLFTGIFWCSVCQTEFEIDRAKEDELICDACGGNLEEAPEDDDGEE